MDADFPSLLPCLQTELVATSQKFFDQPWFNIDYEEHEKETCSLYNNYSQAITDQLADDGIQMDTLLG